MKARPDVVVVGGGVAGLAAANYLARGGRSVVLLEKADAPGGRARTRTLDGFHFNLGPHALYRAGAGMKVLSELGIAVAGGEPRISGGFAARAGTLHTLPVGLVSLLTTGLLSAGEKLEAGRLLAGLGRIDTRVLRTVSLEEWLAGAVASPVVRELFAALARLATYADDPSRLSAGAALDQLRRAGPGVLYLHGGWQTLVDGLRSAAEAAGVRIAVHRAVVSLFRDSATIGVRLDDGTAIPASAVLACGSPQLASELAASAGSAVPAQWQARAVPVRAACLDVALRRLPRPEARFVLGIDRPLYGSVHSAAARLAPEGGALIQLARYGGLRGETEAAVESQLAALLDDLQPGWRAHLVRQRFLPDLLVANAVVDAMHGGLAGRPGPAVPDLAGFYVAGDWVGDKGMLVDASLASARSAAELILAGRAADSAAA